MTSDLLEENAELRKRIAKLEGKISILLSCKNCPENKGGYICQKEYEGKCLTQKTQYIKELQEEIAELRNNGFTVSAMTEQQLKVALEKGERLEKENAELKETLRTYNGCGDWDDDFHTCRVYLQHEEVQMYIHELTEAKEIIKYLLSFIQKENYRTRWDINIAEAEQFLSEVDK